MKKDRVEKNKFRLRDRISGWKDRLRTDVNFRVMHALWILCIGFVVIFLVNIMLPRINISTWKYEYSERFPVLDLIGNDFFVGSYWPAQNLVESNFSGIGPDGSYASFYPPLVALINLPYTLFDEHTAYLIHVCLLILANIACIGLATLLVKEVILSRLGLDRMTLNFVSIILFLVFNIFNFSSYFYEFSIERGNTDILAIFFSLLAMWMLVKKPEAIWLQVILLSIGVHLKIYPAALFAVLLFKHGKKIFLPAIVVNVAYLFVLGPKNALNFILQLTSSGDTSSGVGNTFSSGLGHSAYSYTMFVDKTSDEFLSGTFFILWGIFTLIPLLIWGFTAIALALKKYSPQNAILLLMITIPMMDVVPSIGNDYRLVIENTAAILLIGLILKQLIQKFNWFDLIQLIIILAIVLMIGHSFYPFNYALFAILDKYPWLVLMEVMMMVNILRNQKPVYQVQVVD